MFFILPGKAVRRVNRTVPANISTNGSSVASPERSRGEANGYRNKQNPLKSIRSPHPSKRLHPAHSIAQSPEGYLQSRQWWRWRQLGWRDVGGDRGRRKRKCVFFPEYLVTSSYILNTFSSQFLWSAMIFVWMIVTFRFTVFASIVVNNSCFLILKVLSTRFLSWFTSPPCVITLTKYFLGLFILFSRIVFYSWPIRVKFVIYVWN